jgi:hypothetical protein
MPGDMTHVVKLANNIWAEETENGTFVVRKGERQASPYEYTFIKQVSPKCHLLFRPEAKRYDLIFSNGSIQFGYQFAYEIGRVKRGTSTKSLIGVMYPNGVGVLDDSGNFLAFIPGLHHIEVVDDMFLVAFIMAASEPYVRVYSMLGDFLAEGFMSEALDEARAKVGGV